MMRHIVRNRALARRAAGAYVLLLSYLLLVPHPLDIFGTAGGQAEETIDRSVSAYLQHVLAYAGLVCVLAWPASMRWTGNRALLLCTGAGAVHALATEALQTFVPHRYGDIPDAAANLVGIGVGALLVWLAAARLTSSEPTAPERARPGASTPRSAQAHRPRSVPASMKRDEDSLRRSV